VTEMLVILDWLRELTSLVAAASVPLKAPPHEAIKAALIK